ncbi:MAG: hypothetical protein U0992_15425 [Planctomycetaceae bacterium]
MKHAFTSAVLLAALGLTGGVSAQSYPPGYGFDRSQYGRSWHSGSGAAGNSAFVGGYPHVSRHYHAGSYLGGGYGMGGGYYGNGYFGGPFIYPPVYVYPYGGGYGGSWGGYGGYGGGGYGYAPTMPLFQSLSPAVSPNQQAALQNMFAHDQGQWESPLENLPVEELPKRFIKKSSEAAQLRSVRSQHEGDLKFQELKLDAARSEYQQALMTAPDRPEPYFRLGINQAFRSDFAGAVQNLKLGLQLDPNWPHTGPTLDDLIGERNLLPKTQFKQRVIDWVREDIRDPDRLFLLGVVLHMDNDADHAAPLFEAAARLGGMKPHLQVFLSDPVETQQANLQAGQAPAALEAPPQPSPPNDDVPQPLPQIPLPAATPPQPKTSGPRLPTPDATAPVAGTTEAR